MKSVAIIVLNFNGKECLPRCLLALRGLEYSSIEIVVVDNGSSDNSFQDAKINFPEFTYIAKSTNTGFAAGMNTGIMYALKKGHEFVWLMNYDAEVHPQSLSKLVEAAHEKSKRDIFSPVIFDRNHRMWFCGGKVNHFRMRVEHSVHQPSSFIPYQTDFLTGCALFIRKSVFEKVGLFDERFFLYYEDADFCKRVQKEGGSLWVVPQASVSHEEKSTFNPKKLYYLVHYAMLFFAIHTPWFLRPYLVVYVTIRRVINSFKRFFGASSAQIVYQAYADYFEKFQPTNKLYIHKLPKQEAAREFTPKHLKI